MHNKQTFPKLANELEPIPEVCDHCIGAEILLPRADEMERDHVVAQSHDTYGNFMGEAHANLNIDSRMYQVESVGDEVKKLTSKIIA